MLARSFSAAVNGIEAFPVEVEVNCGWGDTVVVIVGLPDAAVKELHPTQAMNPTAEATRSLASGSSGNFRFDLEKGDWFFGSFQKLVQN
jgi:hypothetical protein